MFRTRRDLNDGSLRLGTLHMRPWQAAVAAHVMFLMSGDPLALQTLAPLQLQGGPHNPKCLVLHRLERPMCVVHASPGKGKTCLAASVALGRNALCICTAGTAAQWVREAGRIGVVARRVDSKRTYEAAKQAHALQKQAKELWVLTTTYAQRHSYVLREMLPEPELLIFDEIHLFNSAASQVAAVYDRVPILGLTGTLKDYHNVASTLGVPAQVAEAVVINVPEHVATGGVPNAIFRVVPVELTALERSAYEAVRRTYGCLQETLIFSPRLEQSGSYSRQVWRSIVDRLAEANRQIECDIVPVLHRCPRPDKLLEDVVATLGKEAAGGIEQKLSALDRPLSFNSFSGSVDQLKKLFARRADILGAYKFIGARLAELPGLTEIDCPVSLWSIITPTLSLSAI